SFATHPPKATVQIAPSPATRGQDPGFSLETGPWDQQAQMALGAERRSPRVRGPPLRRCRRVGSSLRSPVTWGMLIAVRDPGSRRGYSLWMPNGDAVTHYAGLRRFGASSPLPIWKNEAHPRLGAARGSRLRPGPAA